MSRDSFCQIVEPRSSARGRRFSALPISVFVHVLVLLALVVIPLVANDVLPNVVSNIEPTSGADRHALSAGRPCAGPPDDDASA